MRVSLFESWGREHTHVLVAAVKFASEVDMKRIDFGKIRARYGRHAYGGGVLTSSTRGCAVPSTRP
jgi:hypothetical protein